MTDVVVLRLSEFAPLAARLLLTMVFGFAGVAKLANANESSRSLIDFGLPPRLARPFGVVLPPLEIAVAAALLFVPYAWYAAWGALGLLGVFIVGIAANLARGRRPVCNCFGQVHVAPISWRTLVRNGALTACAAWLISIGPPTADDSLWVFLGSLDGFGRRIATIVAAVACFALLRAFRQDAPSSTAESIDEYTSFDQPVSQTSRRQAATASVVHPQEPPAQRATSATIRSGIGLPIGTPAPQFDLPDLTGERHSLESLRAPGKPLLLLFTSPSCESCQALAPKLPGLAAAHEHAFRMVLVSRGTAHDNLKHLKDPGTLLVLLQQNFEVAEAYDCGASPAAILVRADGVIGSRLATGAVEIRQLMASNVP